MGDIGVRQVTGPVAGHGEGPVWWPERNCLVWVDLLAGDVLALDDSGEPRRRHVGDVAAALRPRTSGGLVIAVERGFALVDDLAGPVRTLPPLWTDPEIRMNDGGCDPDGRFYCGSMAYDARLGAGALYRLDPGGETTEVLTGVTISNGFGFAPDGRTAYYVDTPTGRVDALDYARDTGLTARRPAIRVAEPGHPDGLAVDADGHVWVALWGGSAVRRYRPDGVLDAVVELPVTQVTACAFGGPALDRLYITTSRQGIGAGTQPEAGAVFAADVGVRGQAPLPFAG